MLTTTLCGLLFRWWPPVELRETSRDNARSIVAAQS
jgi:nucleoside recognition membrane protein YjiH